MWIQACDTHEINKNMNIEVNELFQAWVIEKCKISVTLMPFHVHHMPNLESRWLRHGPNDELGNAVGKALLPNGMNGMKCP